MCGIFGFSLNRPLDEADSRLGQAGMGALGHRGPDACGQWASGSAGIFLGHTRLAIVDLTSDSSQPMERHGAVLAYNGELYNHREIRQQLASMGISLTTTGDTEVLLKAWMTWGASALDRFDGMFAFALWQGPRVHLVTDPFGEKPLYWAETPVGIYFSSEPAPLVHLLGLRFDPSPQEVAAFLSLGFVPSPGTGFRGLHRVPPATMMTLEGGRLLSHGRYWSVPISEMRSGAVHPLSERELDAIQEVLVESVRRRVRSDAPWGIFLSSGVDSALVAAITARDLQLRPQTLTVAFPDTGVSDEGDEAAAIARHLGLPHTMVTSQDDSSQVGPGSLIDLYGEPNDNLTAAAVRQMSVCAVPFMKVALSGMGGDELFYGYGRYQFFYQWQRLFSLPPFARHALARSAGLALADTWPFRPMHNMLSASDVFQFIAAKNYPAGAWLHAQPAIHQVATSFAPLPGEAPAVAARRFDIEVSMPGSYIPAIERGSMRASLEVRTPFLNRDLLAVISRLDQRAFLAFGQKEVLRRIVRRYLPLQLIDLPKRGFIFPAQRALRNFGAHAPTVPGVSPDRVDAVWRRRGQKGWQAFALRLAILSSMTPAAQRHDARMAAGA